MTTLYIIGNGFDLWHGLPTSYSQFSNFAEEALREIENYYSFDVAQGGPWFDFENSLGRFNWSEFYDAHNHIDVASESFRPSFVYGLEDDLAEQADQHVGAIRECFQEWLSEIDISLAEPKFALAPDAKFLTFNYTSTLEVVYGIPNARILYIHGKAEAFDDLIFGHGDTMEEEPELDELGESNRTMFSDAEGAAKYPFYALQKPVRKILEQHKDFFDALGQVEKIHVIGHSLNRIDLPYFRRIAESVPAAKWIVCCFTADEKLQRVEALVECGVSRAQIALCTYTDLEV
ncbi:bacteriophage abortive infection AbiH family protein [Dyella sp.]|jgi:hypothetical protein|uniref:bacteriophage abortive infection AbiH family protein n=1 Tax=Dyella sp. TaxID=1869338 RepID=UPI002D780DDB|nr:bacteriophage abortive infection AbiH family protein [Dyella sp.]HET6432187.1 bacteriophage abortive infection AbiH family protein [Dyella sp.]